MPSASGATPPPTPWRKCRARGTSPAPRTTTGPGDRFIIRTFPRFDRPQERMLGEHLVAWATVRRSRNGTLLRLVDDLGRPTDPDAAIRHQPGRPRKRNHDAATSAAA